MQDLIDLRSDTVTRPTAAMREAMANARVGDDVYEDDPDTNTLQERAAELLGKEAALFMPSGTMSNSAALCVHARAGDEVLMDREAHSMLYEAGLPAAVAHVQTRQFLSTKGVPIVEDIEQWVHEESLHNPRTALLVLENTHNRAGGVVIPLSVQETLYRSMNGRGIKVHIDGARLFNAVTASGVTAKAYAACADSVTFCLSKGLGCPVGSLLCGTKEFISRARRVRKRLGGGMRQTGILAAAGLYALENNLERLKEDHERAGKLARGLSGAEGIEVETAEPPTNMIYFRTKEPAGPLCAKLKQEYGILCSPVTPHRVRMVTHLDVNDKSIEMTIEALHRIANTGTYSPSAAVLS